MWQSLSTVIIVVIVVTYCYSCCDGLLMSGERDTSHPMFSADDIPQSFLEQHRECCRQFMNWQTTTIVSNIATFETPPDAAAVARLRQLRQQHAVAYINRFCWQAIDDTQRVMPSADSLHAFSVRIYLFIADIAADKRD